MKIKILCYLLLIFTVPIAGEFKFYPFEDSFRVSLGTPLFLFYLLWFKKINPIFSGVIVGIAVALFRIQMNFLFYNGSSFEELLLLHLPAAFYYITYGIIFEILSINKYYERPLLIGLFSSIAEISASFIEQLARFFTTEYIASPTLSLILIPIAIIRSFFVLGFFHALILKRLKLFDEVQRKRNEQMLMLVSNLYVEMIQLTKSMKDAELLTKDCYELYRQFSKENNPAAKDLLKIAGEIHDIKKGHQRIYFGLQKLMVKEKTTTQMTIKEIVNIVFTSNQNYCEGNNKKITFQSTIEGTHTEYPSYLLLSVLNNLVANSVEAIKVTGRIEINIKKEENTLIISITDNGPGIHSRHLPLIFQPGFTTKFDKEGKASTGIGLPYVKKVIEDLSGTIELMSEEQPKTTTFLISIPIHELIRNGENE